MYSDPITDEEWQDTANLAEACLRITKAKEFGMIKTARNINGWRCEELLALAKARGFEPTEPQASAYTLELAAAG